VRLELAEDFGKIGVMGMESKGIALLELGEHARAREVLEKALATETTDEATQYRIARCAALLGRHQRALTELRRAGETDPAFFKKAEKDPVFEGMREMEVFRELVAEK
jgi:tetratricopeptide (TPR) repeat protein